MSETCPKVFLSSVFKDTFDGNDIRVPLRDEILGYRELLPVDLWAYEIFWPKGTDNPAADTIVDRCFSGIKACDLFVFLLTGRHGTHVSYFHDPTYATYLELELFAASVLGKPILILHEEGRAPNAALHDVLVLLNQALVTGEYVRGSHAELEKHFRAICVQLALGTWKPPEKPTLSQLPDWLAVNRSQEDFKTDLKNPKLKFLNNNFRVEKTETNFDLANQLLNQVSSGVRVLDGVPMPLPHGAALFRLWSAMRELMSSASPLINDPAAAVLWDKVFGLWASKASWFGLHGHVWMGPLAAINSQTELREKFAREPGFRAAQDVREPLGARASAIYSIAQRLSMPRNKLRQYKQVIELSSQAIDRDPKGQEGALSIRAHARMQLAQLGYGWNLFYALSDLKKSLRLRNSSGASAPSVGEAMTDLGFCLVLTGRRKTGLSMMQEGLDLLRSDQSPNGQAFLARGLRKLEAAAKYFGATSIAAEAHAERIQVAGKIEAIDQARDV